MPLHKGKSKKIVSKNISEMMNSSTFGAGQSASTKRKMAIAASMREAGMPKKRKRR